MLDGQVRYYADVVDKVFKSEDATRQFHKPDKCKECSFDPYCLGPRRSYVEHYGDAEIQPFRADLVAVPRHGRREAAQYSAETALGVLAASDVQRHLVMADGRSGARTPK
jgi:hypothetical protein